MYVFTTTGELIGEICTNHSMTLEEAIECIGGEFIVDMDDDRWSDEGDNIIIEGRRFWHEELTICAEKLIKCDRCGSYRPASDMEDTGIENLCSDCYISEAAWDKKAEEEWEEDR